MASDFPVKLTDHDPPQAAPGPAATPAPPEKSAAETTRRSYDILENVSDAFVALDRDWCTLYANRRARGFTQETPKDLVGRVHWDEWPAAQGTELERQLRRAMAERVEVHFEHRYVTGTGDVWLEADAYPSEEGLNLFYRDVTGRKHAEEALHARERRFRGMADAMPHIAWTAGPDGAVDYYNQRWYDYSGLTLEQTRGWGWGAVIHPDDLERAGGVWSAAVQSGTVSEVEYRLRRADGEYRWHLGRSVPVRDGGGIVHWVGTATDIEDRRRVEEALRQSEARYRAVFEALTEGITVQDATGLFQEANSSAERILALSRDQMAGRTSADPRWRTVHEDGSALPGEEHPPMVALRTGQAVRDMLMGIHRPDGTFAWLSANAELIPDPATGEPTGVVTSFFDVTAQREAQKDLKARAERGALLNRINAAIRATTDPEIIQETAAALAGEALGADRCYFSLYDPQRDAIRIVRDWHREGLPSVAGEYHLTQYQDYVTALYANGTAVVADALAPGVPPDVRRVLGGFGIRAFLAVPLLDDGKFVAALAASVNGNPRFWTPEEIALMEAVLTQTRAAVEAARASRRERTLLRDVLASVTEGHLLLCDRPEDLPAPLSPFGESVPLSRESGLRDLRRLSMEAAGDMAEEGKHDLATAVSEAGMNAVVHGGGGKGRVSVGADGTVQVRVEDQGSGITMADLPRATLSRGFSTKATLGHGLKMMIETADRLYLLTGPGGTTVVLEMARDRPLPAWL